jgi:hypothetical protein
MVDELRDWLGEQLSIGRPPPFEFTGYLLYVSHDKLRDGAELTRLEICDKFPKKEFREFRDIYEDFRYKDEIGKARDIVLSVTVWENVNCEAIQLKVYDLIHVSRITGGKLYTASKQAQGNISDATCIRKL